MTETGRGNPTERLLQRLAMATLSRWKNVKVQMFDEAGAPHKTPHFRVILTDGNSANYAIHSLHRLTKNPIDPTAEREVRDWATEHMDELEENWNRLVRGERAVPIDPYQYIRRRGTDESPMYRVVVFEIVAPGTLWMRFDDGVERVIDFRPIMIGEMNEPLRDPGFFARVELESGVLEWPNGAGLSPETMHDWNPDMEANYARRYTEGARKRAHPRKS